MSRTVIIVIVSSLCIFLHSHIFAIEPSIDVSDLKQSLAEKTYHQEEYELIDNIKAEIKNNISNYNNYSALAFYCYFLGRYAEALEALKLEVKYAPERCEWDIIYGNLAQNYLSLRKIDEAKKPILKSLKYNPKNTTNRMNLLSFYVLKKQYKEAALELKTLSELDKDRDFYHEIYVWHFDNDKNLEDIVTLFEEAVKVNPDSYLAHRMRGIVIRDFAGDTTKNLSAIMKSLDKALELNPKYVPTYITIANTYVYLAIATKNKAYYNNALEWIDRAYKVDAKDMRSTYAAGYIYLHMGQYDKAIEKFEYTYYSGYRDEKVLQSLIQAYNQKAYMSHYKTGINMEKGLQAINKAIMLDENNGVVLSTKAELLYKMGRYDEAYEYIKRGIKLEPNEPEIKQDLENIEKALKKAKK